MTHLMKNDMQNSLIFSPLHNAITFFIEMPTNLRYLKVHHNIFIILLSSVKYLLGVAYAFTMIDIPAEGIFYVIVGGIGGVFVFTTLSHKLTSYLRKRMAKKGSKIFTRTNKLIVKLKHNGGLPLIAACTPIVLSIPIGCLAAMLIYNNKKKVLLFMIVSVLTWTAMLFGAHQFFDLNLNSLVK